MDAAQDEFARFEVCEQRAARAGRGARPLVRAPRPCTAPPRTADRAHPSYGRVLVLPPTGHLAQSVRTKDWHGSQHATRCSDPAFTATRHNQTSEPIPH
ncbi:hypothetical protein ACFU5B_21765 [Streptomyces murinus]|uniref:hypothetical protein n=1 Tax=Streptomyces murinus TaxID=33900 RepID=UPI0036350058